MAWLLEQAAATTLGGPAARGAVHRPLTVHCFSWRPPAQAAALQHHTGLLSGGCCVHASHGACQHKQLSCTATVKVGMMQTSLQACSIQAGDNG